MHTVGEFEFFPTVENFSAAALTSCIAVLVPSMYLTRNHGPLTIPVLYHCNIQYDSTHLCRTRYYIDWVFGRDPPACCAPSLPEHVPSDTSLPAITPDDNIRKPPVPLVIRPGFIEDKFGQVCIDACFLCVKECFGCGSLPSTSTHALPSTHALCTRGREK